MPTEAAKARAVAPEARAVNAERRGAEAAVQPPLVALAGVGAAAAAAAAAQAVAPRETAADAALRQKWQRRIDEARGTLDLHGNNIGAAGARAVAEALQHNTTVTELHLDGNNIGAVGARAVAEALQHNTTVTTLGLSRNNIGAASKATLRRVGGRRVGV